MNVMMHLQVYCGLSYWCVNVYHVRLHEIYLIHRTLR